MKYWRPLALLVTSLCTTAIAIAGRPYVLYNDGDPLAYFMKAWFLIGRPGGADVPSRGPGYPLWLLLTGAASHDTWWGLIASQIAITVIDPLLVYAALSRFSKNAGLVAALVFMAFGIAQEHMPWVMTEGPFLFLELCAFALAGRWFAKEGEGVVREKGTTALYVIAAAFFAATITKPAGCVFFPIFVAAAVLQRPHAWRRLCGPAALYLVLMLTWVMHDYYRGAERFPYMAQPQSQAERLKMAGFNPAKRSAWVKAPIYYLATHPTSILTGPPNPYLGFMFLMKFYRYREFLLRGQTGFRDHLIYDDGNLLRLEYGPALQAWAQSLRDYTKRYPEATGLDAATIAHFGGIDGVVDWLIANPRFEDAYSGGSMGWIYQWQSSMLGDEAMGALSMRAALEVVAHNDDARRMVLGDFIAALAVSGPGAFSLDMLRNWRPSFHSEREQVISWMKGTVDSGVNNHLPAPLKPLVGIWRAPAPWQSGASAALEWQYGFFKWVKPGLFIGMLLSVPLLWRSRARVFVLFMVGGYFVSAAIWVLPMIMPGSDPRHEDVYAFLPILVIALALARLLQPLRAALPQRSGTLPEHRQAPDRAF